MMTERGVGSVPLGRWLLLVLVGALVCGGDAIVVRGTTGVPPRLSTVWARTLPAIAEVGATYRFAVTVAPAAVGGPDLLIMFCSTVEANNVRPMRPHHAWAACQD